MAVSQPQTQFYTLSEFEALIERPENANRLLELIGGELKEKLPTQEHGMIAGNIFSTIKEYIALNKMGRVSIETRHRLPPDEQDPDHPHSRLPDVSYVSKERFATLVKKGAVPVMPDLAVEIQSPDQDDKEMLDTADYYLANGTNVVLLVYPDRRIVEKLPSGAKRLFTGDDVIDLDPVIPGFSLKVSDIFFDPLEG